MAYKEKTIQQVIFGEIKKRDKITAIEVGERIGISKSAIAQRMTSDIGLANFVEMLRVCGYDITISKAPSHREPGVFFGVAGCDGCPYKTFGENMILSAEHLKEQLKNREETIQISTEN